MLEDNAVLQYQLYKLDISCSSLAIDPHTVREIDAYMAADGHLRLLQILEIEITMTYYFMHRMQKFILRLVLKCQSFKTHHTDKLCIYQHHLHHRLV